MAQILSLGGSFVDAAQAAIDRVAAENEDIVLVYSTDENTQFAYLVTSLTTANSLLAGYTTERFGSTDIYAQVMAQVIDVWKGNNVPELRAALEARFPNLSA